ncbi:AI-2E family transporter [Calothrix sp. CCY 0018]|uniref:AI-2E family transporter n=1 Tax=Calothrix sp. CCY 0018 TaxID=3103864 RepID=UPI0039C697C9
MLVKRWIGLSILAISMCVLWLIREVLLILFAAIVLAIALNEIVKILRTFGLKRGLGVAISVILLISLIFGFAWLIYFSKIPQQLNQFQIILPKFVDKVKLWNNSIMQFIPQETQNYLYNIKDFNITKHLLNWLTENFGNLFPFFNQFVSIFISFLLFFILTIMLLVEPKPYRSGFIFLFPTFYRRRMNEILLICENRLVCWIKATTFTMFLISILSYIVLKIIGVPAAEINAILAGLLEVVPNIGPTLSVIPPILLVLLDEPLKAVYVFLAYLTIQQIENFIIVPLIMKSQVSLLPVITLLSVVIFSKFFGFMGVCLAVPLVIVLQVSIQEVLIKDILNSY